MKRRTEGIIVIVVSVAAIIGFIAYLGLDTPILLVVLLVVIMGFGISLIVDGNRKAKTYRSDDEIVSSSKLHSEMNDELKREGKGSVQAINTIGGVSTNNLARKDKSWSSVPDFFAKMFKNSGK